MNWSELSYFKRSEFTYPDEMRPLLLYRLDRTRHRAGVPIYVTSSYRPGDPRSHGRGLAVDVSDNPNGDPCSSRWRWKVLTAAWASLFRRIGVYDLHTHLDCDTTLPQDVIWWGQSK